MNYTCEHCRNGLKLYPAGMHNIAKGTWQRCVDVAAIRRKEERDGFKFLCVSFSERSAKAALTHYRNRGYAAGWHVARGMRKYYVIFGVKTEN